MKIKVQLMLYDYKMSSLSSLNQEKLGLKWNVINKTSYYLYFFLQLPYTPQTPTHNKLPLGLFCFQ